MGSKITSYQKLKSQNEALRNEIHALVFKPFSAEAIVIKAKYKVMEQVEKQVMAGSPTIKHIQ